MTRRPHILLACVATAMLSLCISARAQTTQPATQPATPGAVAPGVPPDAVKHPAVLDKERHARLADALKPLMDEAASIDVFEKPKAAPRWGRTHPALATFGPEMSMEVLNRMLTPFIGGQGAEFRDTYIRWHLMAIVNKAKPEDRRKMGSRLIQLINNLPGNLQAQARRTHWYEPPEVAAEYFRLIYSGNMTVGYPPFQRSIGPPESYKYMDAAKVAQIQANLEKAKTLKFVTKTDPDAIAWNNRINELNYIIRVYRGELIYALLLTGDPEMAIRVMKEVDRQARLKTGVAFDLMAYVYLAGFDGALDLYDTKTLTEMSGILKGSCIAMDAYVPYGGTQRNFAEYAFHMVYMLQDGGGFIEAKDALKPQQQSSGYNP